MYKSLSSYISTIITKEQMKNFRDFKHHLEKVKIYNH